MEIIFLEPIYKDYIWGGDRLRKQFYKNTPYEKTAESWEIAANANGTNIIKNGEWKGKTLGQLFSEKEIRIKVFGKKCENLDKFPILIKFIDAKENLSVQVHPDDFFAKNNGNDCGKTEMWYIIDCKENSNIVCGFNEKINKENLSSILYSNKIEDNLKYLPIKKGDVIYIPSGTIHAIMKDTLVCEIQQNSDLTYRVFDWNRIDKNGNARQLHIKKALEVINLENNVQIKSTINKIKSQNIVSSSYFFVDKIIIENEYEEKSDLNTFYAINVIKGNGKIIGNNLSYDIKKGDSFLIPATIEKYYIRGNIEILKTYIR